MLLEKAKEYAQDCTSGKEVTTFEVKKQCEWFLNDLEKQNEIENKLKISVNSVKQLKNTITYLNEILDKTFVYQVIKTFNVNDDDFNVIITLKNNLTIIIKGTYLINSLIENLNLEYEHNKERVIAYE